MNHDTKSVLVGMLASVFLVVLVCLAGAAVHAKAPQPSAQDYTVLANVKQNQKVLAKDRDAYSEFLGAKQANAEAISELKDGWTIDWKTMTLVPSFQ